MDEGQKKNSQQFAANFGAKEFLRFGCTFIALQMIGIALTVALGNAGYSIIFIAISFSIIWFAPYWQPAYFLIYKMMGNKNLPSELPKAQRKGWSFLIYYAILGFKLFLISSVFSFGIRLLFFK